MLLLAAMRCSKAPNVAEALEDLLPLIAETPAIADLELKAVRVNGMELHRVTLQELRKQDEWLYGPDPGLYLGAGRNAVWLAVGGNDRELPLQELLGRPSGTDEHPAVLKIDLHLAPWLTAGTGRTGKQPAFLDLARNAFARGDDRLQIEVTAGRGEVRLHGRLEAGYIRLLGEAWRARQRRSSEGAPPNLAAPVLPKP